MAPRIEIGDVEKAKRYIYLGVRHFCVGWERYMYKTALRKIGEYMLKLVETFCAEL